MARGRTRTESRVNTRVLCSDKIKSSKAFRSSKLLETFRRSLSVCWVVWDIRATARHSIGATVSVSLCRTRSALMSRSDWLLSLALVIMTLWTALSSRSVNQSATWDSIVKSWIWLQKKHLKDSYCRQMGKCSGRCYPRKRKLLHSIHSIICIYNQVSTIIIIYGTHWCQSHCPTTTWANPINQGWLKGGVFLKPPP